MNGKVVAKMHCRNSLIGALIAALIVSGCATTRTTNGITETSGGCNPAAMALFGAALGALLAGKNNRNKGAVIGGAVGGLSCVAWNYKTEQTKTAAQVNSEYKAANNGNLPSEASVVSYKVAPDPSTTLNAGNPMVIRSKITVVEGGNTKDQPVVEEQLVVMHDGKSIANAKKRANEGGGSGEYSTKFNLDLPAGVPQGYYPVRTALFLDGRQVETRSFTVQVVQTETGVMVAMLQ
jgi:hypothetical protein